VDRPRVLHTFGKDDHRNFNRNGAAFDKGETFSGVDYEKGLLAVDELKKLFPNSDLSLIALKWILQFEEISGVIPGASKMQQLESNLKVEKIESLKTEDMQAIKAIYEQYIKADVHASW